MAESADSDSKTLFLDSLSLAWFVLRSWTLCMCLSNISWLWFGSGIIISVLVHNSVLISCPREIPMCWTPFSHVVRILLADFSSPYVNIDLSKALDSPYFDFSFLEVAWCLLPAWLPLTLPRFLPPLEPPPLPEPPIPLCIAVYCRRWYQPYFLLGQRSLNLRCQWSSLLGLVKIRTLWICGGFPLVSLCL